MCDTASDDEVVKDTEFSWNSLKSEIDSFSCLSEISILEQALTTDVQSDDAGDEDDGQDGINLDHPESSALMVCHSEENEEVVDETLLPEKLRNKKWIIGNFLGKGSYFHVYQAYADGILLAIRKRHLLNRRNVLSTSSCREIEHEYQAQRKHVINVLSKIGCHDNIAAFLGFRRVGILWEMFVEYAAGGSLFHEIQIHRKQNRRLPEETITSRFRDLIRAVAYLHEHNIAHLDIKAENCLLTKWGSLKLSDFDYAVIFKSDTVVLPHKIGTKAYAPPERFISCINSLSFRVNPASLRTVPFFLQLRDLPSPRRPPCADVWSCGIILHLLIAFQTPWPGAHIDNCSYAEWHEYINRRRFGRIRGVFPLKLPVGTKSKFSELLENLLETSEDRRIKIAEVVDICWLKNEAHCKPFVVGEN
ncbi:unnamed protein product [Litomosoides sigmodontis]|uniref:non-specific serine/threonine protein kinase n=1 Tax=Litomosoides sigmodontis TaxID=42156 RepID=A0A3P6STA2_LITSI|nr:unnamed protein product [Litomosoides sigmodontis]